MLYFMAFVSLQQAEKILKKAQKTHKQRVEVRSTIGLVSTGYFFI